MTTQNTEKENRSPERSYERQPAPGQQIDPRNPPIADQKSSGAGSKDARQNNQRNEGVQTSK